jgi:deazaflavin-dependent oxidoreductase (nitroreductase family)
LKKSDELNQERFLFLTTTGRKTGKPHKVELWFALDDGKIFLSHEGEATDWMKNIRRNQHVTAMIGPKKLDALATITGESSASREKGKKSLYEKYYGPAAKKIIDDWFELSTVVELTLTK